MYIKSSVILATFIRQVVQFHCNFSNTYIYVSVSQKFLQCSFSMSDFLKHNLLFLFCTQPNASNSGETYFGEHNYITFSLTLT